MICDESPFQCQRSADMIRKKVGGFDEDGAASFVMGWVITIALFLLIGAALLSFVWLVHLQHLSKQSEISLDLMAVGWTLAGILYWAFFSRHVPDLPIPVMQYCDAWVWPKTQSYDFTDARASHRH